jgi:hypothetical protein
VLPSGRAAKKGTWGEIPHLCRSCCCRARIRLFESLGAHGSDDHIVGYDDYRRSSTHLIGNARPDNASRRDDHDRIADGFHNHISSSKSRLIQRRRERF